MIYDIDKRTYEIETKIEQLLNERIIPEAGILSGLGHYIYKDLVETVAKFENDPKNDPFIAHSLLRTENGSMTVEEWIKYVREWLNEFKTKHIRNNRLP